MNRISLQGKVVAITGGARGIGAATARAFAERGAHVAIGDVDVAQCARTAADIGPGIVSAPLDVTDRASFTAFLDMVERSLGPLDVLINNAGIMPIVAFAEESQQSIERQLNINVGGVITGSQLALQRMIARGASGHIVNVASAAGRLTFPGVSTYNSTKFAVVGLTSALAAEYRSHGITFSVILPAIVRTELTAGLPDHPLLRAVTPDKVAAAVVNATARRRFEVPVPGEMGVYFRLAALLPHGVTATVMRLLGADTHLMKAAHSVERAAYEARAASSVPSPRQG
ncbi:SDR family oxidoreductase [Nocardia iowensis]|uniref:SDR family oxidoreductase n=1 Tax=Nocardia iowensis TaxID=204891 RepID=A0ABX8RGG0_NOCIO|nr:SDR family oxidoreductase [Nocardia iowensis]QXN88675.1 SDR family oxidoreductase [Nocardia iowensis]